MVKMVTLLVRRDDYTHEEFVEYWMEEHVPLAKELPGLQRYVTSVPKDHEKADYDGMVELYFEGSAALGAAFDSEVGQEVMADAATFADMDAGSNLVVSETVQVDEDE